MCLIISRVSPDSLNTRIKEEHLENGWVSNDDGAGFMAAVDGEFILYKSLQYKPFREELEKYMDKGCPLVIHFRAASTQTTATDLECVHPMRILESSGFVHNGFITLDKHPVTRNYKVSDTVNFNDMVAKELEGRMPDWWLNPGLSWLLESTIGTNKLVFLNAKGDSRIFNEALGIWDDGLWFSNNMYKEKRVTVTGGAGFDWETNAYVSQSVRTRSAGDYYTTGPKSPPYASASQTPPKPNGFTPSTPTFRKPSNGPALQLDDLEALDKYLDDINGKPQGQSQAIADQPAAPVAEMPATAASGPAANMGAGEHGLN